MNFKETNLKGAYVISNTPFEDERGFFTRWYDQKEFEGHQLATNFVNCNNSGTFGVGSIRGMHYQLPPHAEVKLIKCVTGCIFDVIVDLRKNSPTFLKWFGSELSSKNKSMMYVPAGFAHGFQTLTEEAEIVYMASAFYNRESERGLLYNDQVIGINWPMLFVN